MLAATFMYGDGIALFHPLKQIADALARISAKRNDSAIRAARLPTVRQKPSAQRSSHAVQSRIISLFAARLCQQPTTSRAHPRISGVLAIDPLGSLPEEFGIVTPATARNPEREPYAQLQGM
jgi:hypothetical protein